VVRYSEQPKIGEEQVLIMDAIGHLRFLYRYAAWVLIGGGFGAGIHNTLEPAAYGKPVVFGPRYQRFMEAVTLVEKEAFYSVEDAVELERVIQILKDDKRYAEKSVTAREYILENRNAVALILNKMEEF
jgi:3-deoxy-D-manno-octulosonic-acid transferase